MDLLDTQIYALIGEEGFARLVAAFYRRVPGDEILGPLYRGRDPEPFPFYSSVCVAAICGPG